MIEKRTRILTDHSSAYKGPIMLSLDIPLMMIYCQLDHMDHISAKYESFLHDLTWISPWIKSISNESDITNHVIASQLSGYCDVIRNRLWRHQQNENRASVTWGRCVKTVVLSSFMPSLCHVRNKIMYVISWRTVSALTRVLFWCLFPSLLRNLGNKHQNERAIGDCVLAKIC